MGINRPILDTATWRPEYVRRLPPCNERCPAGHDIQSWLAQASAGDYRGAWETMMAHNPLPATMGRVCYHSCEGACNRQGLDQAVNIHAIERFVGDLAIREGWAVTAAPPSGKKVLVIGAGPAGLSAAYHLAMMGHRVTIAEAGPAAGGMMRFGIPSYRLPRNVLDAEVERIKALGVDLQTNRRIDDIPRAVKAGGYGACFLAVGAHVAKRADIPTQMPESILDAVSFLCAMEVDSQPPRTGRRVAVYGGGNTAIDVARTALRLGAEEVRIIYRRTRAKMPAHDFEIVEALDEGVVLHDLRTIKAFDSGELVVEKMILGADGWPQPTGETESIGIDTLILALGQDVDTSLVDRLARVVINKDKTVRVGADFQTGHRGLYGGGDMVPADRTVTVAIGHGKKAARHIDAMLRGNEYRPDAKPDVATFERLHTWYYEDHPRSEQPVRDATQRRTTFFEFTGGLVEGTAAFEARRCLSCGNCMECDNCVSLCPYGAVSKLGSGEGFKIDLEACKGCGLCVEECPCGAMQMTRSYSHLTMIQIDSADELRMAKV